MRESTFAGAPTFVSRGFLRYGPGMMRIVNIVGFRTFSSRRPRRGSYCLVLLLRQWISDPPKHILLRVNWIRICLHKPCYNTVHDDTGTLLTSNNTHQPSRTDNHKTAQEKEIQWDRGKRTRQYVS